MSARPKYEPMTDEERLEMLRSLSRFKLLIVRLLIDALRFKEWVKDIPLRWVKWQAGK